MADVAYDATVKVVAGAAELLKLRKPPHVYHMGEPGSRAALIDALWSDAISEITGRFSSHNPHFVSFFEQQGIDSDEVPQRFHELQGQPRFEAVIRSLFRSRSQMFVPLETAALSVLWLYHRVPDAVWNAMSYFGRVVMSRSWTEELCDDALARDPGPRYPVARGISAAVFDNFMMRIGYGSYSTSDSSGSRLEMTNWATAFIPAIAVPGDFSIDRMLENGGIFRNDWRLDDFIDLFSPWAEDIVEHQRSRWSKFLEDATQKRIWEKEPFDSPYPPTHFHYHEPIMDRLQSSYDDVNYELNHMRRSRFHQYADCIMLGGDGLSYMRLIHRLSQDPRLFLESKPVIIPRMGEAPHGKFHLMHGDWRIWAPLILKMAEVVGNKQVKRDPTMVDFNTHEHFLRILTQAFAEYVVEISATGTDFRLVSRFISDANNNISFAYVVYFLYLFAFKYLAFRNAVRRNDSKTLDKLWRENLSSARTALANKVNYRQMSIILVYWGNLLVEPLQTVYHNTRTLRWVHSHVGWDMPIEKLNMWLKEAVVAHVTVDLIKKFIRRLNFAHVVVRSLQQLASPKRKEPAAKLKAIENDVELIKQYLKSHLGTNYAQATAPSTDNLLNVDRSEWGGLRNVVQNSPWMQMSRSMNDYRDFVKDEVTKLCGWHHWLP